MTDETKPPKHGTGWRPDIAATEVPKAVKADGLHGLAFFLAPIGSFPDKVDLTTALERVWGPKWFLNQGECGSCVAFGAALACDLLTATEIVSGRRRKPNGRTDPMTVYWGSRVEIGKGQLGRSEGSIGVWAAKYLKIFGALEQRKYEAFDLTRYTPSVCCGSNAYKGVPDALEPIARQYPVRTYAQVRTFDEAVAAIAAGYPVTIASAQGFRMQLDANGFGTASGSWNHQQCVVGYELTPVPCLWIANSWGPCYSGGPAGWNPAVMKVRKATAERMLREGDSWALSDHESFAPKAGLDFSRLNF
jgi:hypothetical protein